MQIVYSLIINLCQQYTATFQALGVIYSWRPQKITY